jgi:hypothetical protein
VKRYEPKLAEQVAGGNHGSAISHQFFHLGRADQLSVETKMHRRNAEVRLSFFEN